MSLLDFAFSCKPSCNEMKKGQWQSKSPNVYDLKSISMCKSLQMEAFWIISGKHISKKYMRALKQQGGIDKTFS